QQEQWAYLSTHPSKCLTSFCYDDDDDYNSRITPILSTEETDNSLREISSGSTTTHFDISLSEYDSFIFDLTHEEFVNELAHIISPLEYDCFYFWNLPDPSELMSVLNSGIREILSTTLVNLPIEDDH
nr:hypothetical protein [Tanacetum cinerariifolium]